MSKGELTRRVVVLGTGTGVGKTWLSCRLLSRLRQRGSHALGLKPIESGVIAGSRTDAAELAAAALGSTPDELATSVRAPFQLPDAVSPHLAARRAGTQIELDVALTYVRTQESSQSPAAAVTLIESAGGLFTPLAPGKTNFDFARALEPAAWLLVAPDALGVLHDLGATLLAARALGRMPDAVALCRARPPDASSGTNAEEVARMGIATRPWVFPDDGDAGLDALLGRLLD